MTSPLVTRKGRYFGYESSKGKSQKRTKVQSEETQQMSALRASSRLPAEVRYVQDMLQNAGPFGENPRCQESQLVIWIGL